jgi:hypothetical protein
VGVFGHSEGGKAAIRACQIDSRFRACLNQDGEMFGIPFGGTEPIQSLIPGKPTLAPVTVIYVAEPDIPEAQLAAVHVTKKDFQDWRAAKNRALRAFLGQNSQESDLITITASGFIHGTFMDTRLLRPIPDSQDAKNHATGTRMTRTFFDAHLRRGEQRDWSRFVSAPYEGVRVEQLSNKR